MRVRGNYFQDLLGSLNRISADVVNSVVERITRGDYVTATSDDERCVLKLMKEVKIITKHVCGSPSSKVARRNEIRALMAAIGLPSFFITINPADIHSPILKFLAGSDIDIDRLLPDELPKSSEQSMTIARDPFVAAKFFQIVMNAFYEVFIGYTAGDDIREGLFGLAKGYYGMVEAQGRGSLHCHMLIWLEGGLHPDQLRKRVLEDHEFQTRLIRYLESHISNGVQEYPRDRDNGISQDAIKAHPCSFRGLNCGLGAREPREERVAVLARLVDKCQVHIHNATCYKFCRPGEPKTCRFSLSEAKFQARTAVDSQTGAIDLRCLDGMVNNFNETILDAVRCNMDIKFVSSGGAAKAIIYYVTDYISKMEMSTSVAFTALKIAIEKLDEYEADQTDVESRARKMLQKCAFVLTSHQEISAQQAASYLMGYDDHFSSHGFKALYWRTVVSYIDSINDAFRGGLCHDPARTSLTDSFPKCPDVPDIMSIDDMTIDVDRVTGRIVGHTSQIADYVARGHILRGLSLWDFVAQCEKFELPSNPETVYDHNLSLESEHSQGAPRVSPCDMGEVEAMLHDRSRLRPFEYIRTYHPDYKTHAIRLVHPSHRKVPVSMGPLPKRNEPSDRSEYCKVMLVLFKPWYFVADLCADCVSWEEAYMTFMRQNCSPRLSEIMDNIQALHECKEARDNHYAQRHKPWPQEPSEITEELRQELYPEPYDESELIAHVESIEGFTSRTKAISQARIQKVMDVIEKYRVFPPLNCQTSSQLGAITSSSIMEEVTGSNRGIEDLWKVEYKRRRGAWRRRTLNESAEPSDLPKNTADKTGSFTIVHSGTEQHCEPHCRFLTLGSKEESSVPSAYTRPRNLSKGQALALKIIVDYNEGRRPGQLRMFLTGSAGTGKSKVVEEATSYFQSRGESGKYRLTSFMGIAAHNISGVTLHASLLLGKRKGKSTSIQNKADMELMELWEGVEFLFVDEVSMISCQLLYRVNDALCRAKGCSSPFGGIHVIFSGDFAQLPPVRGLKLYTRICKGVGALASDKIEILFGKLLWLSVDVVVTLTRVFRQSGEENQRFVELLERLRDGNCNDSDIELLNSRVIGGEPVADFDSDQWRFVPILVYDNAAKDAINERAALSFAEYSGNRIDWCLADDCDELGPVLDPRLRKFIQSMHSGQTKSRLGRFPVVKDMPIIISQNFDVEGGIVNGSRGTLQRVRFSKRYGNESFLTSAIVKIVDADVVCMTGLQDQEVPVIADTIEIQIDQPYSNKKWRVKRTQLPLLPAFSLTAHRAEGQTLPKVMADLESCGNIEAAYVMVSRVPTLNDLLILRPFDRKLLQNSERPEYQQEVKRLEILSSLTLIEFGDEEDSREGLRRLEGIDRTLADAVRAQGHRVSLHSGVHEISAALTQSELDWDLLTEGGGGVEPVIRKRKISRDWVDAQKERRLRSRIGGEQELSLGLWKRL